MDYCDPCRRHLNGALACPGCGTSAEQLRSSADRTRTRPEPDAGANPHDPDDGYGSDRTNGPTNDRDHAYGEAGDEHADDAEGAYGAEGDDDGDD
ncbi:hypothetical protein ACFRNH_37570, partial [Streptomyces sp. NPDC056785]